MTKTNDDFDTGFNKMMSSAIEYEMLTRQGESIPRKLQKRMDEGGDWLNNLSDEDYSSLIR